MSTPGPSQKKRRLQYEASFGSQNSPPSSSQPSSSQPSSSQPLRRISGPPLSQIAQPVEEMDMEDEPEEESRDELYVMLKTSIVGIQYYKGELRCIVPVALPYVLNAGLVGRGEEVSLVREPHNRYDRNAIQVKNIGGTQVCGHDDTPLSRLIERANSETRPGRSHTASRCGEAGTSHGQRFYHRRGCHA